MAKIFNFLNKEQIKNIEWNKKNKILFADAKKRIPLPNDSVECIYTSHMIEHLSQQDSVSFLKEALRVLEPGGILRVVVPDLKRAVNSYVQTQDADAFIKNILLTPPPLNTIKQKISLFFTGYRHHQWMYDEKSLSKLINATGFSKAFVHQPGETNILNHENLNLYERSEDSICVEGLK
jgi:predicted SAM-dependent methyltransferase